MIDDENGLNTDGAYFNEAMRNKFILLLDAQPKVDQVLGSPTPLKLSLAVQARGPMRRALVEPPKGAILEIWMDQQNVFQLLLEVAKMAKALDWPLPQLDAKP